MIFPAELPTFIAAERAILQKFSEIFLVIWKDFCKIERSHTMNAGGMTQTHFASDPDELAPTRQSLLERLRDLDDNASWQEFFDTYWKLIYCAAAKAGLSDTEAEEVVQETVIGVARNMECFRYDPRQCSFKGWLMHVTERRIIDHLRKRQTRPRSFEPLSADTSTHDDAPQIPDPAAARAFEGMWEEEWQKNLVDAAMERVKRTVKAEHYQIFYLSTVKNMAARDIGQLLGISAAKVYVVSHRVARLAKREVQMLAKDAGSGTGRSPERSPRRL
jgi:RNA polymerase sigma factor (sigma-70 family)